MSNNGVFKFQAIDWLGKDYENVDTSDDDSQSSDEDNFKKFKKDKSKYQINVFGKDDNERTITLEITDFTPYFYIKLPDSRPEYDKKTASVLKSFIREKLWGKYKDCLLGVSILYKHTPETCKLILGAPKMLELSVYDGIPHLLTPVVTEPPKAVMALKWEVRVMEERYKSMSKVGVRNISGYNKRLAQAKANGETLSHRVQTGFDPETGKPIYEDQDISLNPLPLIVVVIDEVADLMLVAGKDIEAAVQRLAQMARAAGIHVIMATQRPSVDVITGTIKANFPTRISFQVSSKIDSRTILGEQGGEQLLGKGDMLFMEGGGRITRIHGPFVSDEEVESVVNFLKQQGDPEYDDEVIIEREEISTSTNDYKSNSGDDLYDQAVALVARERKASTSFIQRHLKIGYNRAATIIEKMETEGVVSSSNHVGKREVLIDDHSG